jgi:hypothetical protein
VEIELTRVKILTIPCKKCHFLIFSQKLEMTSEICQYP